MKQEVRNRTECSGTAASTYVLCPHIYTCPYLSNEHNAQIVDRDQRGVRILAESIGVVWSWSEDIKDVKGEGGQKLRGV